MNIITKNTDYAIRAVCFIAKSRDKVISVTELTKKLETPRPFLRGVLQKLNKKGFLKSYKGKGGGFRLALSPARIFIIELMKVFQGPIKLQEHVFKGDVCPEAKRCFLKKRLDRIEKELISELGSISIALMLKEAGLK